jgi:hypothetical protein
MALVVSNSQLLFYFVFMHIGHVRDTFEFWLSCRPATGSVAIINKHDKEGKYDAPK